jgi:hypothetical protein
VSPDALSGEGLYWEGNKAMIRWAALAVLAAVMLGVGGLTLLRLLEHPQTPLASAAARGEIPRIRGLAASGAALDAPGAAGFTPLDWAAREGKTEAIAALIAAGASADATDHGVNGWTALMHAVHRHQLGAVTTLLARGADPNRRARWQTARAPSPKESPLMLAASEGDAVMVETLLAAGADPRATYGSRNLLTYAAMGGDLETVRALRRAAPDLRLHRHVWDQLSLVVLRLRGKTDLLRELQRPPASAMPAAQLARAKGAA